MVTRLYENESNARQPRNFEAAVDVSLTEQNLRKRFNLRSGKSESNWGGGVI